MHIGVHRPSAFLSNKQRRKPEGYRMRETVFFEQPEIQDWCAVHTVLRGKRRNGAVEYVAT